MRKNFKVKRSRNFSYVWILCLNIFGWKFIWMLLKWHVSRKKKFSCKKFMVWTDIARFLKYFRKLFNSFINILEILQDFNRIFSKYSLKIMVLSGYEWYSYTYHGLFRQKKNTIEKFAISIVGNHNTHMGALGPRNSLITFYFGRQNHTDAQCLILMILMYTWYPNLAIHRAFPHSTEYCRNMSKIFPIFHCKWNIVATFLSNIEKYFIATLQF